MRTDVFRYLWRIPLNRALNSTPNVQPRSLVAGLAQTFEEVVDPALVAIQPLQRRLDKRQIGIQRFQIGERGACFVDLPDLGERSHHIGQTDRPTAIERPGSSPNLDRLGVVA